MTDKLPAYQWYPGDWRKDPAIQSLDYEARGVWRECLDFMHESPNRGWLVFHNDVPMMDIDVAMMLGIDEAKWKQIRSKLEARKICEIREDGAIGNRRMIKDEAIRRARAEAGRKGGMSKTEEPKESKPPSKRPSKTEANGGSSVSSSVSKNPPIVPPSPPFALDFEEFWKAYPRKVGKKAAFKKYQARRRAGVSHQEMLDGLKRYTAYLKATDTAEAHTKHAATFLGPDEWWADPWHVPEAKQVKGNGRKPDEPILDQKFKTRWTPKPAERTKPKQAEPIQPPKEPPKANRPSPPDRESQREMLQRLREKTA